MMKINKIIAVGCAMILALAGCGAKEETPASDAKKSSVISSSDANDAKESSVISSAAVNDAKESSTISSSAVGDAEGSTIASSDVSGEGLAETKKIKLSGKNPENKEYLLMRGRKRKP